MHELKCSKYIEICCFSFQTWDLKISAQHHLCRRENTFIFCHAKVCPLVCHSSSSLTRRFASSVVRFGEISPLWQTLKWLRQFNQGLFCIWQKCYLLWQILYTIGQFFMVVNGQIMKTTKAIWSHCFRGLSSYLYSRKINLFLSFSAF